MTNTPPRPFSLSDAMVLVVAVAAGLAVPRTFGKFVAVGREVDVTLLADGPSPFTMFSTTTRGARTSDYVNWKGAATFRPRIKRDVIFWARQALIWPGPCLAALTLATSGLGLLSSRRPLRRAFRRPGMAAGLAVALAASVALVRCPQLLITGSRLYWREWWLESWFTLPRLAGFAVAASWLTLAAGGRWKLHGGWTDALGVALGACWVAIALIDLTATWYHALPF